MQENKLDILYIVSHGFAARMVLQTGLLVKLSEKGYKVGVVTPDINDVNLVNACEKYGIQLVSFETQSSWWSNEYLKFRKYIFEDIKANPALWEKHLVDLKGKKGKNPWHYVRPYFFILCYHLVKIFPFFRKILKKQEQRILTSKTAQHFLRNLKPKLVVSTYPVNFIEGLLLKNAKDMNIKTCIHLLSWDNISCKGHFPALADKYIAWGPIMKEEFQSYYNIPSENIFECGVPHFDLHFQSKENPKYHQYIQDLGLDDKKPYLFFAMSSPRFAPKEIDIVERLSKKIEENIFGEKLQLIVRPHPQNVVGNMADKTWIGRLDALISDRVKIDYPQLTNSKLQWGMKQQDMFRLSNLLAGAIVTINSGSTVSIDALMTGRPVVLTSFDAGFELPYWKSARRLIDFTHLKKFIDLGGVRVTSSLQEFEGAINYYLNNPNADMEVREHTRFQECGVNDGQATHRVVLKIKQIINE